MNKNWVIPQLELGDLKKETFMVGILSKLTNVRKSYQITKWTYNLPSNGGPSFFTFVMRN